MSSEQLADGVNPLDAELAATWDVLKGYSGRDTDLGIARRFGGAAAAYSLRDIGAMNGRVVRVRRDSDDTEEDFSANQVASGALETFVQDGAAYNEFSGDPVKAGAGSDAITLTKVSNTGFTAEISGASGTKQINFPLTSSLVSGDDYFVSFDYTSTSTSTVGVKPRTAALGSASNDVISATNSGFYGGTGDAGHNGFDLNNTATVLSFQTTANSFTFTVSNLRASRIARNGFVETLYDQSANLRDAIQGTATNQPSIVQNGGIVKVNSKPAITFNGNDNFLEVDGSGSAVAYSFSPSGDMGMFIVSKQFTGNVIDSRDGGGDGIFLQQASANTTRFRYNGDGSIDITATRDAQHFSTMTLDGTTLSASVDGGTAGTDTVTAGVSTTNNLVIGKAFSGNNSNFMDGEIQEAIFYENNKTSDKSNIETDIDNFYSIT